MSVFEGETRAEGREGIEIKARARALLNGALGGRWGFVRWADREDALLVTDAGRAAARLGMACAPILEELARAGWRVEGAAHRAENRAGGLWWLDPAEEAFRGALRARRPAGNPLNPFAGWRDGDLGELQAFCAALLRGGPLQEEKAPLDERVRAQIRGAWKRLDGPPARASRWAREAAGRFAAARRSGAFAGEYACGVLLERYLRRMGCGVP